jgi:2-oxoglutarate ferredoxin oxidoreductase subunit beta
MEQEAMETLYERPRSLNDLDTIWCPGCGHGVTTRLIAEVIDELGIRENVIGVIGVGCYSTAMHDKYFNFDAYLALHGRAPAVATGIKRMQPDKIAFTYQGDGDLAAEGFAEIIHTAARGENITVIMANNAVFAETGGHMTPTSVIGQRTQTSPAGRDPKVHGQPLHVAEMLAALPITAYVSRVSAHNPNHVDFAKMSIKKAFENQINGAGFSYVEIISTCPSNWRTTPMGAIDWVEREMLMNYSLGELKRRM